MINLLLMLMRPLLKSLKGKKGNKSQTNKIPIPYSFNSLQWHHTQTQSAHLIATRVAHLRWRVYSRVQSRISAGMRKYCA